jgi:hypothetical protein
MLKPAIVAAGLPGLGLGAPEPVDDLAKVRALEVAARAHAVASEAERCAGEVFELLGQGELGEGEAPDAAILIRDARHWARTALASAHSATGELAAAASGLAIALRRVTEYADLHRRAREAIARAASEGDGGVGGDGSLGA